MHDWRCFLAGTYNDSLKSHYNLLYVDLIYQNYTHTQKYRNH